MLYLFILGTIIGSFLNVIILRAEKEEKITGRSYCPNCKKKLKWWELIPVFSFFILGGKCSECKKKISWQYPLVELLTGICFALTYNRLIQLSFFNTSLNGSFGLDFCLAALFLGLWLYFVSVLIVIAVYDLRTYYILDTVLYPAIIIAFLSQTLFSVLAWKKLIPFFEQTGPNFLGLGQYFFGTFNFPINLIIGAGFYFVILGILAYGSKGRAMGYGDPKLGIFLGALLLWPASLIALLLSFCFGGLVGLITIVLKKKTMKSYLPFGPFLALAGFIVFLFGDIILKGYFKLFS